MLKTLHISDSKDSEQEKMYTGLPVDIFTGSNLVECLNVDLFDKRKLHYKKANERLWNELKVSNKKFSSQGLDGIRFNHSAYQEKILFLKKWLNDSTFGQIEQAIVLIDQLKTEDQLEFRNLLFEKGKEFAKSSDKSYLRTAISIVPHLNEEHKKEIITYLLKKRNFDLVIKAANFINNFNDQDQLELSKILQTQIAEYRSSKNFIKALKLTEHTVGPINKILIDKYIKALSRQNLSILEINPVILHRFEEKDLSQLWGWLSSLIQKGLAERDINVVEESAKKIDSLPIFYQDELKQNILEHIEKGVESKNRDYVFRMLQYMDQSKVEHILSTCEDLLPSLSTKFSKDSHTLYTYEGKEKKQSSMGAEIDLCKYEGKAYRRTIPMNNFLCWKQSWEAWRTRKKKGFDYVPIEPILSFLSKKNHNKIMVTSKLLHMSLQDFSDSNSYERFRWKKDLINQKNKILDGLKTLGIKHGDTHGGKNFCVQFHYTKSGEIDTNKLPRLYLIDWDGAIFYNY